MEIYEEFYCDIHIFDVLRDWLWFLACPGPFLFDILV
jgi:hypothetical protein